MLNKTILSPYTNIYMNLALEQALARKVQKGERILLFWTDTASVVFGRFQNPWSECRTEQLDEAGILPARRYSGGGTVFHDPGNLNYSVISDRQALSISENLEILADILRMRGVEARVGSRRDLWTAHHKISGSAFQLHKDFAIHHGTLLVNADLDRMQSLLGSELAITDSRSVASVPSPVANIGKSAGLHTPDAWIPVIREAFSAVWGGFSAQPVLLPDAEQLRQTSVPLSQWDWIFGQTPPFSVNLPFEPPVRLQIDGGRIITVLPRDGPASDSLIQTDRMLTPSRLAELAAVLKIHPSITADTLSDELKSKEDYHVI